MEDRRFNSDVWFNWQQPAVPLFLDLTFEACGPSFWHAFGLPFFTSVLYYRTEGAVAESSCQASWLLREEEGVALGRLLTDLLQVPVAAERVEAEFDRACERLLSEARGLLGPAPEDAAEDLLEQDLLGIDRFRAAFLTFYAIGSITEPVQWYCESELARLLPGDEELRASLFTMEEEPYAFQVERSLLRMAIAAKQGQLDGGAVSRHRDAYHWTANNYARVVRVGEDQVREELAELASSEPEQRLRGLEDQRAAALRRKAEAMRELPPQARRLCMIADTFGSTMADRRKAVMNKSLCGLDSAARRIADWMGVDFADLKMFSPGELRGLRGADVAAEAERRRFAYVQTLAPFPLDQAEMAVALELIEDGVVVPRSPEPTFAAGEVAAQLLDQIDQRMALFDATGDGSSVRGEVVHGVPDGQSETISGTCRVVTDPFRQRNDFEAGEILLASSTTPDFVPIMRKAAAVVTNMGGMLQHAAHFAREEQMPCIVGTGFATSAFETGQTITLNLTTGVIGLAAPGGPG